MMMMEICEVLFVCACLISIIIKSINTAFITSKNFLCVFFMIISGYLLAAYIFLWKPLLMFSFFKKIFMILKFESLFIKKKEKYIMYRKIGYQ